MQELTPRERELLEQVARNLEVIRKEMITKSDLAAILDEMARDREARSSAKQL